MKSEKLGIFGLVLLFQAGLTACFFPAGTIVAAGAGAGARGAVISFDQVLQAKVEGKGTTEVYPVPPDEAWEISKAVLGWAELDQIWEYRAEGYMLSKSSSRWRPTLVGAWVEPVDENQVKVTVVRKPPSIFTRLRETTFHERFAEVVEIVKAGKPLPLEAPK